MKWKFSLAEEITKGIPQYRVKWKGYDDQTWEPIENLKNAQELVKDYDRQHPFRKKGRKCEGPNSWK